MPTNSADEHFLQRALDLARQGIGLASPNPHVGAVIVDAHGNIAGTGTYTYAGVKHAEILALEAAGSKARGGTLYINLEPHAHQGRTPPCTDALIAAGIRRVVAAMPDPNPKVSGLGFEKLRAAGLQVDIGQLQEPARRLNESFARYIRHGVPLVTLKSAITLDGKIAPPAAINRAAETRATDGFTGHWITGEAARAHAHELRHQHDAILVGIGTVLADNPLLTDRSGRPRRRLLMRVILDSRLRLPLDSQLIRSVEPRTANSADDHDVLVFTSATDSGKKTKLESHGVRVETFPPTPPDGRPDLSAVLRRLAELEITSVMIEGGSTVNGAALSAGVVDKVFLYYAPQILGANAVPFATNASFREIRVNMKHLHRFGEDLAIEAYLRDPYEG
ncbi:MAG: bifunctional diaminohydroxyphosphoribosylaminopyrimidine deaminase/5-amino-6-(5-phosphoribosylamino)uracil reductase RibD [Candidatus Sulfotelmatobacter sp.]